MAVTPFNSGAANRPVAAQFLPAALKYTSSVTAKRPGTNSTIP